MQLRASLWILVMGVAAATSFHADVVDRVMAVVGGQAITWSDVRAARALRLVSTPAGASDADVLDRLVSREVMRAEVDRFSVAPLEAADIDRRVAAARAQLAGPDRTAALDALGMSEPRLRAWLEDDSRIDRYVQQRFDVAAQPTDEEVLTYFQSREREFVKNGQPQPFASAQAEARARLVADRRQQLIDEWVATLRRRAAVVLIPAGS